MAQKRGFSVLHAIIMSIKWEGVTANKKAVTMLRKNTVTQAKLIPKCRVEKRWHMTSVADLLCLPFVAGSVSRLLKSL